MIFGAYRRLHYCGNRWRSCCRIDFEASVLHGRRREWCLTNLALGRDLARAVSA
jgi:hypothetical protein